MPRRSDQAAKNAFKACLKRRGFSDVRIVHSPVDIEARSGGRLYRFEIKHTDVVGRCFGAATTTEWEAALKAPKRFKFVVARRKGARWLFTEFTPSQFMRYSDVPPFKVYFRIPAKVVVTGRTKRKSTTLAATLHSLRSLIDFRRRLLLENEGDTV